MEGGKYMVDESNVHVKVAMADVLGLLVISMFTFAVAAFGLGANGDFSLLNLIVAIGPAVGIATLIAAVFCYVNENLLGTAIFGPLAVFFLTVVTLGPVSYTHLRAHETDSYLVCRLLL